MNNQALEMMKHTVEKLWVAIHNAPEIEKPKAREEYRMALEAFKKRLIWIQEMNRDEAA